MDETLRTNLTNMMDWLNEQTYFTVYTIKGGEFLVDDQVFPTSIMNSYEAEAITFSDNQKYMEVFLSSNLRVETETLHYEEEDLELLKDRLDLIPIEGLHEFVIKQDFATIKEEKLQFPLTIDVLEYDDTNPYFTTFYLEFETESYYLQFRVKEEAFDELLDELLSDELDF